MAASGLSLSERFWRSSAFSHARHRLAFNRAASARTTRLHAWLIRLSRGRIKHSHLMTGGMEVLVLTTTGRRSGKPRSTPLAFLRHGSGFAVLASNAGGDHPPAWLLNLRAAPQASVLVGGASLPVAARRADAAEDAELWAEFIRHNPGFAAYRTMTERAIPVVVLELT